MALAFFTRWLQYEACEIELFLLTLLYCPGTRKEKYRQRTAIMIVAGLVLSAALALLTAFAAEGAAVQTALSIVSYVFAVVYVFIWLYVCYTERIINTLFYLIIGFYIRQIIMRGQLILVALITAIEENSIYDVLISIGLFLVVFAALLIWRLKKGKRQALDIDYRIFLAFLAPVLVVNILFGCLESLITEQTVYIVFLLSEAVIYFVFIVYELEILVFMEQRRTSDMTKKLLLKQQIEYESFRSAVDYLNIKCHDLKHQIRDLKNGQAAVSEAALEDAENSIAAYESYTDTGSSALDILISEKYLQCSKSGIQMTVKAETTHFGMFEEADLYSLFGNAIDNAIEYECTLPEEKRFIRISVKDVEKMLLMRIENFFEGKLELKKGLPQTTKADKTVHGFGMKSMKYISEKYHGSMNVETSGDTFCLTFIFPI